MKSIFLGKHSKFALTKEGRTFYIHYQGGRRQATLIEVRLMRMLNICRIQATKRSRND